MPATRCWWFRPTRTAWRSPDTPETGSPQRSRDRQSARIEPTWVDAGAGLHPDAAVARLTRDAQAAVGPRIARVVGHAPAALTRTLSASGESALGDFVADAQRAALRADIAVMNPGGMRADLPAGRITWGDVLTSQPFGNRVLALNMTGAQLLQVLEEQWSADPAVIPRVLKTSGLYYEWDPARPAGHRVVLACDAQHRPLRATSTYRVAVNDFLVGGGDDFKTFGPLPVAQVGPLDIEAFDSYVATLHGEITAPKGQRIFVPSGPALQCPDPARSQPTSSP